MTTVLLALGDNDLLKACQATLHCEGHTTLVLDRPLAVLSMAACGPIVQSPTSAQ